MCLHSKYPALRGYQNRWRRVLSPHIGRQVIEAHISTTRLAEEWKSDQQHWRLFMTGPTTFRDTHMVWLHSNQHRRRWKFATVQLDFDGLRPDSLWCSAYHLEAVFPPDAKTARRCTSLSELIAFLRYLFDAADFDSLS
jgi:hypothetical protein